MTLYLSSIYRALQVKEEAELWLSDLRPFLTRKGKREQQIAEVKETDLDHFGHFLTKPIHEWKELMIKDKVHDSSKRRHPDRDKIIFQHYAPKSGWSTKDLTLEDLKIR